MKGKGNKAGALFAKYWPALLFAAAVLCSGVTAYFFSVRISDSDAASELVLGHLLAEQNKLITTDWFPSTELRLFMLNLVFLPLFKLFSNWHTIRLLATLLLGALLTGSYYYLCRRMKISLRSFLLSASLLILPVNVVYGRLILYHGFYVPCYIYGFWIAGLYLALLRGEGKRWRQVARLGGMLLLSLLSCMNGLWQLPTTILPVMATALVIALRNPDGAPNPLGSIQPEKRRAVWLAMGVFAAGALGFILYNTVLAKLYAVRPMGYSQVYFPPAEKLRDLFVGYLSLFGFQANRAIFSVEGMLALGGAAAAILMIWIAVPYVRQKGELSNVSQSFMGALFPVAMLGMTALFLFFSHNEDYPQYYLFSFLWVFPFLGVLLDQISFSWKTLTLRKLSVLFVCLVLLANGVFYNFYYVRPGDKQVEYNAGIPIYTVSVLQGAIDYINDNGLDVGYATFWQANIITEETDRHIPMIGVDYNRDDHTLYYYEWLTNKKYQERAFVSGKSVFIIVRFSERSAFEQTALAAHATLRYEEAYCSIYTFDDPEIVWKQLQDTGA